MEDVGTLGIVGDADKTLEPQHAGAGKKPKNVQERSETVRLDRSFVRQYHGLNARTVPRLNGFGLVTRFSRKDTLKRQPAFYICPAVGGCVAAWCKQRSDIEVGTVAVDDVCRWINRAKLRLKVAGIAAT